MSHEAAYHYRAKIVKVIDGDTLDLDIDLGFHVTIRERVRLAHIDTAELNSSDPEKRELAQKARSWLNVFSQSDVLIQSYKKEKFGRYLVEIWTDENELSLNDQLVEKGLAIKYDGGKRE